MLWEALSKKCVFVQTQDCKTTGARTEDLSGKKSSQSGKSCSRKEWSVLSKDERNKIIAAWWNKSTHGQKQDNDSYEVKSARTGDADDGDEAASNTALNAGLQFGSNVYKKHKKDAWRFYPKLASVALDLWNISDGLGFWDWSWCGCKWVSFWQACRHLCRWCKFYPVGSPTDLRLCWCCTIFWWLRAPIKHYSCYTCVNTWTNPENGIIYILVFRQMLFFGEKLNQNLLQFRAAQIWNAVVLSLRSSLYVGAT